MLFDVSYSSEILLKFMSFQSCCLAKCLGVSFSHWSWASGSAEKLLEDIWADIWKISYAAKIPVLWMLGETKEDPKTFQSLTLFLQMTAGWLQSYWNCGVASKPVAVLAAGPC